MSICTISLTILFEVFDLFHYFAEHFGAVLRRITAFNKAYFYIEFKLIANNLIIKPVRKRRLGINDLFNAFGESFALIVDNNAVHVSVCTIFEIIRIAQ